MNQKSKTIMNAISVAAVFVLFLALFSTLALLVSGIGVFYAFQLFFSVGWWASALVIVGVLLVYVTALAIALEYIERKTS
jgi:hypothetical protein